MLMPRKWLEINDLLRRFKVLNLSDDISIKSQNFDRPDLAKSMHLHIYIYKYKISIKYQKEHHSII